MRMSDSKRADRYTGYAHVRCGTHNSERTIGSPTSIEKHGINRADPADYIMSLAP